MNKLLLLGFCSLFLSCHAAANSERFTTERLTQLTQQHQDQRLLVLLWSLDCPPCLQELALVAQIKTKLKKSQPTLPLVLINTDADDDLLAQSAALLNQLDLNEITSLHFADGQAARSRFIIDPSWQGELPRCYFYQADGQRRSHSGLLKEEILDSFLTDHLAIE